MGTLTNQLRDSARQAWSALSDGWHELMLRASGALTPFRKSEPAAGAVWRREEMLSASWGLLVADLAVEDERIWVRLEAPGLDRDELRIDVEADRLCISGEKRIDSESTEGDYRLLQCAYGSFRRELALPYPVDGDHARASYRDGVLRIELPRLAAGGGRRIVVQGS